MKVFSMFSGIGAFDLACQNLGIKIIGACEKDVFARDLYAGAFPGIKIWPDATDINPDDLPDFDICIGGPPCQSFSVAGRRAGINDPRGVLILEVARVIRSKRPRHILLENVQGLLSVENGEIIRDWLRLLDELHYDVEICHHNTADHLPQNRPRLFFVCTIRGA